jgi:tRNA threonylcarbamoyladenosine biosynthesis protein TsaE
VSEEVITHSAEETTRWGRELASRLKAPLLVLLTGELGSGKTTLTKGIVAGLGAASEDEVTSPTFTLVHVYGSQDKVYHGDLYRIESLHDFETLGLEDVFAHPAVVILECPKSSRWSRHGRNCDCGWNTPAATSAASLSCRRPPIECGGSPHLRSLDEVVERPSAPLSF